MLWLWRRPVATAAIGPLAWEPPYAAGAAQERAKKKKKKKKRERERERKQRKADGCVSAMDRGQAPDAQVP